MSVLNTMLRDLEHRGARAATAKFDSIAVAVPGVAGNPPRWQRWAVGVLVVAMSAGAAFYTLRWKPRVPAPVALTPAPLPASPAASEGEGRPGAAKATNPLEPPVALTPSPLPPAAGEGRSDAAKVISPPMHTVSPLARAVARERGGGEGEHPSAQPTTPDEAGQTAPATPAVAPSVAMNQLARAMDLIGRGHSTDAAQLLQSALQERPDWADVRAALAALQAEMGDRRQALATLLAGAALDPIRFAPTAAQLQAELNDPPGALQTLERVPEASRERSYHALAAAIAQRAGQHDVAVAEYGAALRVEPSDGVAWAGLGISLQALGRNVQAAAAYQSAAQAQLAPELRAFVQGRLRQLQAALPPHATESTAAR